MLNKYYNKTNKVYNENEPHKNKVKKPFKRD